jgi:hypothetical protein
MKKTLLFLILATNIVAAQSFFVMPQVGINNTMLYNKNDHTSKGSNVASISFMPYFGANIGYYINKRFSLLTGIAFNPISQNYCKTYISDGSKYKYILNSTNTLNFI